MLYQHVTNIKIINEAFYITLLILSLQYIDYFMLTTALNLDYP